MENFPVLLATTFRRACLLIFCTVLLAGTAQLAAQTPRAELALNTGWHFRFGAATADAAALSAAEWPEVTLPHTWNAADGADGGNNYARGTGWYVRRFRPDPSWAGKRVYIQFDGANRTATVFLNGKKIGEHRGGFTRFRFDLTEALAPGENTLAVQVDNSDDGLAPVSADFTFFGGIYRGVKLLALDPRHVDVMDCASDGVYVTPREVTAARAEFSVAVRLRNDSAQAATLLVRTAIRDAQGTVVATREESCAVPARGAARGEQNLSLDRPHLWNGRSDPHQYVAEVTVHVDGAVRDMVRQPFGLRAFRVDPDRGFFLNGAHLDLHGVSRHQDRAGKGWAISAEDEREDFALIEEIGATAIRVAHYPQSPLWFDLADARGMVVWAEIPVVNEVPATAAYTENARQQLRELIRQNYNRPSICFWGVGNETREMGEVSGGRAQPNGPASDALIANLAALAKQEDPARLSVYASHHKADDARNFHTDVLGFNKYFGWYGGAAGDFAPWADDVHRRYPALAFAMSEYGAGANPRQHEANAPKPAPGGPWHPEEYQAHYHEIYWDALRSRDYIWGKFVWNMFDFAADIRAEGEAPGLNDKGLVTYDRKIKKDAFYWYQANWSSAPMLHLTGRRFTPRPAGATEIKVYTNAARGELLLNGVSCGVVDTVGHILRWQVALAAGINHVVVRAATGAPTLTDECDITAR